MSRPRLNARSADSHIGGSWGTTYKGFRMVEVMQDNTVATYILNPETKMNEHVLPVRNAVNA